MKFRLISFFLVVSCSLGFGQEDVVHYYDTLFYKSGLIKPCTIVRVDAPKVYYTTTNSKGIIIQTYVPFSQLKNYKDYDLRGEKLMFVLKSDSTSGTAKYGAGMRTDSLRVAPNHLSVNPFSPFFLGLNFDYMYRFGKDLRVAVHIPFRVFTFFGNGILFNTGLGLNYIPYESDHSLMYVGVLPEFYFVEGDQLMGLMAIMGGTRNLRENLTLNGYIGVGPKFGDAFDFPLLFDAHIGLGFRFGTKKLIKTQVKTT